MIAASAASDAATGEGARAFDATAVRALAPPRLYALDGRVALVTGAGGGLGRWLAAGLGAAGAAVLLTDVAEEPLHEVEAVLRGSGVDARSVAVDLADADAPERLVAAAVERFGRLDALVNNAGVNRRASILEVDAAAYDLVLGLDLRAPYFLARAAASAMRAGGGGSIVNVVSVNAVFGLEHNSLYGAAKAGLAQLTRVMALEWSEHGIRANAVGPGFFDTPLAVPIWSDPDRRRWLMNRVPLRRPGRPDELVGIVQLLVSDAGSFVTGQTFYVDGGFLAGGRWFTPDE